MNKKHTVLQGSPHAQTRSPSPPHDIGEYPAHLSPLPGSPNSPNSPIPRRTQASPLIYATNSAPASPLGKMGGKKRSILQGHLNLSRRLSSSPTAIDKIVNAFHNSPSNTPDNKKRSLSMYYSDSTLNIIGRLQSFDAEEEEEEEPTSVLDMQNPFSNEENENPNTQTNDVLFEKTPLVSSRVKTLQKPMSPIMKKSPQSVEALSPHSTQKLSKVRVHTTVANN